MTKKKKPSLSAEDEALWSKVTRSVTPLDRKNRQTPLPSAPLSVRPRDRELPADWFTRSSPSPDRTVDKRSKRRIAKGHMTVDRSIDLHGLTQDRAFALLRRTIESCVREGHKVLIVVTGKGGRRFSQTDGVSIAHRKRDDFEQFGGVLKRMVPLWLEGPELKPFVQSYGTAAKEHGGEGALYVLLRRKGFDAFRGYRGRG